MLIKAGISNILHMYSDQRPIEHRINYIKQYIILVKLSESLYIKNSEKDERDRKLRTTLSIVPR